MDLPFSANVDRKGYVASCGGPRVEDDDEKNHDNEEAVLESAKDRDLRRRQVQCGDKSNVSQQLKSAFGICCHHEYSMFQAQVSGGRPLNR